MESDKIQIPTPVASRHLRMPLKENLTKTRAALRRFWASNPHSRICNLKNVKFGHILGVNIFNQGDVTTNNFILRRA